MKFDEEFKWVNYINASPNYTKEEFEEHSKGYERFTEMRSEILDVALHFENLLSVTLLHFLVEEDYSRHRLLRALVFETESCSFMQKRKMLSTVFDLVGDKISCLSSAEAKSLRRDINDVILTRDMFAHGVIFYDGKKNQFVIRYFRGAQVVTTLTEQLRDDFMQKCTGIQEKLTILNDFFRENRIEYDEPV